MANRVKEDEKNERIIRGLLKLPENRRCINCNSLVRFHFCSSSSFRLEANLCVSFREFWRVLVKIMPSNTKLNVMKPV